MKSTLMLQFDATVDGPCACASYGCRPHSRLGGGGGGGSGDDEIRILIRGAPGFDFRSKRMGGLLFAIIIILPNNLAL